jgi:hypothetical protein
MNAGKTLRPVRWFNVAASESAGCQRPDTAREGDDPAGRPAAEPTSRDTRRRRPARPAGSMRMGPVRPQARASAAALAMSRD